MAFFRGTSLRPVPPGDGKTEEARYCKIHEGEFDEASDGELGESGRRDARRGSLGPTFRESRTPNSEVVHPGPWVRDGALVNS